VWAGNPEEIDTTFATLAEQKIGGLLIGVDPLFYRSKEQIVALAARYRIPTIYDHRMYADAGGLISYGAKWERTLGTYAGRILAGAKPADLPFQMPDKFELVFNRKTADALGITLPLVLETEADEIIE
jgi:putative tryptophan/tyrosine transport system substrate-binding protein